VAAFLLAVPLLALAAVPASAQPPTELFLSEYVEGSSFNKAVEIFNGTGASVDLGAAGYDVQIFFNGSTSAGQTISLTGTVAHGDVYVLANSAATAAVLAAADQTSGGVSFNGDDAVVLRKGGTPIDSIGQVGNDPGSQWGSGDASTQDNSIRRKQDVCAGDAIVDDVFDPAVEWDGFANNTFDGLGGHVQSCTGPIVPTAQPLLLTEVVVTPTAGEYVEIHNPTGGVVDLSDYYLTDATFAPGGTFYYNIVTGAGAGGGGFSDFHARFPDGASIAPGEFQTVSMSGSEGFFVEYGIDPTYELFEDGASADGIPDMREALPGSIAGQGGLTNGGEFVVLYFWDGATDLVTDVDYAVWGDKDEAVDKTGVAIDGPDADSDTTTYQDDTVIPLQDVIAPGGHSSGSAFQRIDFTEGTETATGGNGVGGNDETSENLSVTWSSDKAATPNGPAPTDWVINEIHADPEGTLAGDANGDGVRDGTDDEFVEIVNNSGGAVDISGWTLSDAGAVRHTFPAGTVVADQCSVVVFGGGTPTGAFGNSVVQTASSGSVSLNNGGDLVILNDGSRDVVSVSYGSEGGDNQSLTLDPDIIGVPPYVKHAVASGSGGTLFSPGTRIDGSGFGGCPSPWVINEIHADPASGASGDANGDGVRHFGDDEFVEIVNSSGGDVDISGWTLADGFSVRHTFPAGSVVLDGCSVVVFGGGTPSGAFGNSLVQTASGGSLGLNNGGDDITLSDGTENVATAGYGGEGGDNQSLTLDPDVTGFPPRVKHTLATGSGDALFSPGTRVDGSQFAGCPVTAEIYEIQGDGFSSPLEGRLVSTDADVVTAVAPDGFFMQTPAAESDFDVDTSDGIFVFTGGPPGVAVGDLVDVTGDVQEFFGFTEFGFGSSVRVTGTGPVPPPVSFNAAVPSPDPLAPSCAIEYECYEGMLVEIAEGTVTGPNQRFGVDPIAEVHIVARAGRAFREPGIEFPGIAGYPEWDGNPEVFELDPDKLGLPNRIIPAGSTFSATGVLGFEFGGYELWPASLTVDPALLPVAVRPRDPGEFTVGTLNLFRLGASISKISAYVREVMGSPDILALQEIQDIAELQAIADQVSLDDPTVSYTAYLEEGNDVGGIDVGFLTRESIQVDAISQVDPHATFVNPLTREDDILHDRPPLLLQGSCQLEFGSFPIAAMTVHNRSLGGIDGAEGERVRVKRLRQAESIAAKVQDLQTADPGVQLVVLGDLNAFEFSDGFVDAVSVIEGDFDPADSFVCSEAVCLGDLVEPNLDNQVLGLDAAERYSFIFRGSAQVLDHALTSVGLADDVTGAQYGRGNADAAVDLINDDTTPENIPLRASDHDGLVVYISKDEDLDGVPNNLDACPGTVIPESVPTIVLRPNHWALLDEDGQFDTSPPPGHDPARGAIRGLGGPGLSFDLGDTAGCSCEQIIAAQELGRGHEKFGCSNSAMLDWVALVNP
jgi:predicted extracellular nuclease